MTLPFDLTPFFAGLTVLLVLPAVAFTLAAVRSRFRRRHGATRLVPRVETRPAIEVRARSA
jgi:hypothetical protein